MIITPIGKATLTPQEIAMINMDRGSVFFRQKVSRLTDSDCDETQIYRYGRIVIKTNKPMYTKREVFAGSRLSSISPVFLPILAYDDHSFVAPYIDGRLLGDSGVNLDFINSISYVIAEALLKADIICRDLHNENVIVTHNGFHVIDLEHYRPMDDHTRKPLPALANFVFEELTQCD